MKDAKKKAKKAVREPGPMDQCVMVCKQCSWPEFGPVYQIVWMAEDHPDNQTGKDMFYPSLHKYACTRCGCADAVLPPGFEAMRAHIKAAQNPMRIVGNGDISGESPQTSSPSSAA
jgi:hypothetical protein